MSDKDVAVGDVSCLGQCDGAPAVSINDHIYRNVTTAQAEALVLTALGGSELPEMPPWTKRPGRWHPIRTRAPSSTARCGSLVATRDRDGVIAQLKASGLSGLGGAGFPTGVKWEAVRKERGPEKYVVCNADESEPGTIKDRFIMQQPAEPGDRRHDHRGPGHRRAKGHSLYPARVSGAGEEFCTKRSSAATKKAFWAPTCSAPA